MTGEILIGICIGFTLGVAVMAIRIEIKNIIWRQKLRMHVDEFLESRDTNH